MRGFFITGTDTHIGKTIVTSLLAFGLRRLGVHCCPIKPIAAGGVWLEDEWISEDAMCFKQIAGLDESLQTLNPLCLEYPSSPHFAAKLEGITLPVHNIIEEVSNTAKAYQAVLIEGVGGWMVPVTDTYLVQDFAKDFRLPVVVVVSNRLGAINHTLLTVDAIRHSGQTVAGIIFNYTASGKETKIHLNNIETIAKHCDAPVLGKALFLSSTLIDGSNPDQLWQTIKDSFQWDSIIQLLNIPPKT